jgi:CBS domain containing-hemolysin-like protein
MSLDLFFILKASLLVFFLSLSAFFSGSETALFSLDPIKAKRLTQTGNRNSFFILHLLEDSMRSLTTILAGNTLVNIAISAIITSLLIDMFGTAGVGLSIGVTTFILLVFGEVTPKTIAIHNNERLSSLVAGPLYFFSKVFTPFLFLASKTCDLIINFFKLGTKSEPTLTEEEFKTVIEVGHRHGVVGKNEKEMVVSVLELMTTTAYEVMTPRTDIKAVAAEWTLAQAADFAKEAKCAKFPVYRGSYDNILGVVYAKDLFLEKGKPLTDLIRPVLFVPGTQRIAELIQEFYRQKSKMTIVVDEYGGTSGLVTMEDVLEEVFGEIYDEFEIKEKLIEGLQHNVYRISGKTPIYKVNEECLVHIAPGDYETIAGYLLDVFGKIPQEGERLKTKEGFFTIEKIVGRRIKTILLERM